MRHGSARFIMRWRNRAPTLSAGVMLWLPVLNTNAGNMSARKALKTGGNGDQAKVGKTLDAANEVLCEYEARPLLAAYGIGDGATRLAKSAQEAVDIAADIAAGAMTIGRRLDMRYHGQGHEIEVSLPPDAGIDALPEIFQAHYTAIYGAALLDTRPVITTWKVEASAAPPQLATARPTATGAAKAKGTRQAYFGEDYVPTPVYDRQSLSVGAEIEGPALIEERESTVVIGMGETVQVDEFGNLVAELTPGGSAP